MRILKFLATGLIGLSVNLGVFQFLFVLGVPYLAGSIGGFIFALFVGFLLQKFWTFRELSLNKVNTQFILYGTLALCNLAINTVIVYVLVEHFNTYHLIAQTVGAGLVAIISFFVYKFYIFRAAI